MNTGRLQPSEYKTKGDIDMNSRHSENIKVLDNDPIETYKEQLVRCNKFVGKSFVAKLIAIRGDELYFQISNGKIIMDRRQDISHMEVYEPRLEMV